MLHSDYYSYHIKNIIKEQCNLIYSALPYNDVISFEDHEPVLRNGTFIKDIKKLSGDWYATIVEDAHDDQPTHLSLFHLNAETLNQIIGALETQKIL